MTQNTHFSDSNNKFSSKYNTPRVYQILSTITFLNLPILMFVLYVFKLYDPSYIYGGGPQYHETVLGIFFWNFGYTAQVLAEIIAIIAAVIGIIFIWMNRPKISGICGGILLLEMAMSLLRIWDFSGYYYDGNAFYDVYVYDLYYILWGSVALLCTFIVLSIIFTKNGPRQPKVVTVVGLSATATVSYADELKKYKELCDSGVITQEEFDAKKKEILEK